MAQNVAQTTDPFEAALTQFQGLLVDLNGDGRPDAVARPQAPSSVQFQPEQMPTNALIPTQGPAPTQAPNALMPEAYGPPSPYVDMPIGMHGETMRSGPSREPTNALLGGFGDRMGRMAREVRDDPLGAMGGALTFFTGGGVPQFGQAAGVAQTVGATGRGAVRNALREFTPAGQEANAAESRIMQATRRSEDVGVSRAAHWELQGRDAGGRFQKLDDETRAARARGINARRVDQKWREMEGKYWRRDENGEPYLTEDWVQAVDPPGGLPRKR